MTQKYQVPLIFRQKYIQFYFKYAIQKNQSAKTGPQESRRMGDGDHPQLFPTTLVFLSNGA